jgi:hypothetical protein
MLPHFEFVARPETAAREFTRNSTPSRGVDFVIVVRVLVQVFGQRVAAKQSKASNFRVGLPRQ